MSKIARGGIKHSKTDLSKEQVSFERAISRREPSLKRFTRPVSKEDLVDDDIALEETSSGGNLFWRKGNRLFKVEFTEV